RAKAFGADDWRRAASDVQCAALVCAAAGTSVERLSVDEALRNFARRRGAEDWMVLQLQQRLASLPTPVVAVTH
ncbi:MAG: hypothetical protein KDI48_13660, partial [Xanthomonadales bacterium]|nr:hypothetical protein [Xanthomonadales bacterium]